jgi:hemerythrin
MTRSEDAMLNFLYIVWNEKNNLNIPIIDEQHHGITATINSFHHFVQKGHGQDVIRTTLFSLEQFTELHFETEESFLKESGYPGFEEHRLLHQELMKKTRLIARDAPQKSDTDAVLQFLKQWWLGHINIEDRKYAPHVIRTLGITS